MENNTNTLPTAEEYLEVYLKSQPLFPKYDRWIDFALSVPVVALDSHYKSAMHEYAVLFAKYHREKQAEEGVRAWAMQNSEGKTLFGTTTVNKDNYKMVYEWKKLESIGFKIVPVLITEIKKENKL